MENRLISIVMPSFNSKNYIEQTINSVKNQTYKEWELIIVDDCSNDGSQEFISNIIVDDSRIKLIKLEKNNGGPAAPRNIGVREAKGFWVALLDSDDIWHPEKLELQVNAMVEHQVAFSSTSSRNFRDESEISFDAGLNGESIQEVSYLMQRIKGRTPNSSVIVERALLLKYPFNEDASYKAVEDYDCYLRIHKEIGHSIKIKERLLFYRLIDGQISGSKFNMLKKVFFVHRCHDNTKALLAMFLTMSHLVGAVWQKFVRNGF